MIILITLSFEFSHYCLITVASNGPRKRKRNLTDESSRLTRTNRTHSYILKVIKTHILLSYNICNTIS